MGTEAAGGDLLKTRGVASVLLRPLRHSPSFSVAAAALGAADAAAAAGRLPREFRDAACCACNLPGVCWAPQVHSAFQAAAPQGREGVNLARSVAQQLEKRVGNAASRGRADTRTPAVHAELCQRTPIVQLPMNFHQDGELCEVACCVGAQGAVGGLAAAVGGHSWLHVGVLAKHEGGPAAAWWKQRAGIDPPAGVRALPTSLCEASVAGGGCAFHADWLTQLPCRLQTPAGHAFGLRSLA